MDGLLRVENEHIEKDSLIFRIYATLSVPCVVLIFGWWLLGTYLSNVALEQVLLHVSVFLMVIGPDDHLSVKYQPTFCRAGWRDMAYKWFCPTAEVMLSKRKASHFS